MAFKEWWYERDRAETGSKASEEFQKSCHALERLRFWEKKKESFVWRLRRVFQKSLELGKPLKVD
jgi:hypothetical protein